MASQSLPVIARQLVQHGLPASTPVALIESGTTDNERRLVGTLATIESQMQRTSFAGPVFCVVGEVVGLALAKPQEFRFESRIRL